MVKPPKRPEFDYINNKYGLKLQKNTAVLQTQTGRRGVVVRTHPGMSHYIDISWDGCPHVERPEGCGCGQRKQAHGPFHPTDGLEYPGEEAQLLKYEIEFARNIANNRQKKIDDLERQLSDLRESSKALLEALEKASEEFDLPGSEYSRNERAAIAKINSTLAAHRQKWGTP
jgi:hypothetical protein